MIYRHFLPQLPGPFKRGRRGYDAKAISRGDLNHLYLAFFFSEAQGALVYGISMNNCMNEKIASALNTRVPAVLVRGWEPKREDHGLSRKAKLDVVRFSSGREVSSFLAPGGILRLMGVIRRRG
jgi:hypothetical protein